MSPLLITGLVIAGLFILISIGYINHTVENRKLEKARLRAELSDRLRRCTQLSEGLPGQLMTPALKLLLTRLEQELCDRLIPLDKGNAKLSERSQNLATELAKGEAIEVRNPVQPIASETKAKEVRFMLEDLHSQIVRGAKEGQIQAGEAKRWLQDIQRMLVLLHLEFFNTTGKLALQNGQPRQARLAFERGVQYVRKQPDPMLFKLQLNTLEKALAHADALVLEQGQPIQNEANQLSEGLEALDEDGLWKKKNIYE